MTHHWRLRGMRIAPRPLWAGVMPIGIRQRPTGRRPLSLQPEKRETTCGLWQSRPSSKPLAASAIAPDPCRGWGRHPSAHIRAQREPVVPPAGTGTEYRRPEGSPDGSPRSGRRGVRRPLVIDGSISINGVAANATRREMTFSSRRPVAGQRGAHTVAEGCMCWGIPRVREIGPAVKNGRRGAGIRRRQDTLREVRCLRGAPRFPVKLSIGSVLLQSG